MMIAQLPSILVAAFQSPSDIRESWGVELYQLWKEKDPEHEVTARARMIASRHSRPAPCKVYETLITASGGKLAKHRLVRSVPVLGTSGAVLFREQDQIASVTFTVPKTILSATRRAALKQAMLRILDGTGIDTTAT